MNRDPFTAPFAVFDVETIAWDQYLLACSRSGDEERSYRHRDELCDWTRRFDGRVYAHSGGTFDFLWLHGGLTSCIVSGSRLLHARYGRARLWDSYGLMQLSLAKIGAALCKLDGHDQATHAMDARLCPWRKLEVDRSHLSQLSIEEVARYCAKDCAILYEAIRREREWIGREPHPRPRWPATSGGSAIYLMEAWEPEGVRALSGAPVDVAEHARQRGLVIGGRVEAWREGEVEGPVYVYDVKSSYPYSWVEAPVPLGPWHQVAAEHRGVPGVYWATVRQPRHLPPIVPIQWVWTYDGNTAVTSEEIETIRDVGGEVTDFAFGFVSPAPRVHFGKLFAERLYAAKAHGDPWAKLAINAAHGKFDEDLLRDCYFRQKDGSYALDLSLELPRWYQRPLTGAFVLSRARLRLWRAIVAVRSAGYRVYYCDTDSVHTDCPPGRFPVRVGAGLGDWNLEGCFSAAVYCAPKLYALKAGKVVSKGVPPDELSWDLLCQVARGTPHVVDMPRGLRSFLSSPGAEPQVARLNRTVRVVLPKGKQRTDREGDARILEYT